MGQRASKPGPPATEMQVLALSLPRTGTSSMSCALEILLGAPSYHGGAQLVESNIPHMRRWIDIHHLSEGFRQSSSPPSPGERQQLKALLAEQYRGFASCSDTPAFYFAEEMVEIYPDAKVIITTRDRDSWWKSKLAVNRAMRFKWRSLVVWPIPAGIRYWPEIDRSRLAGVYSDLYIRDRETASGPEMYDRHMEYLEQVVPKDRLHYFNLKDGWGPLCEILGKEIPDVPFPHLNENAAMLAVRDRTIRQGLMYWAILAGALACGMSFSVPLLGKASSSLVKWTSILK